MSRTSYAIAVIAIATACTLFTRLFPFLLFGRKGELSPMIRFLGNSLPAAVIAILVVYCVKGTDFTTLSGILPQFLSIALVVVLHIWKRSNLISIAGGTICYMLLIQCVFK